MKQICIILFDVFKIAVNCTFIHSLVQVTTESYFKYNSSFVFLQFKLN